MWMTSQRTPRFDRRPAADGWRPGRRLAARLACTAILLATALAPAAAQMPDVSQMSGVPLPSADLATGSVSVRVVRSDLSDGLAGLAVELHGGGRTWQATTDETGRATFTGVPVGTTVHAMAAIDGRQVESRDFPMPAQGGVRVILSAAGGAPGPAGGLPTESPHAAFTGPVEPGTVALGGQSRFVIELVDEALEVYYLFEIMNAGEAAIAADPIVITLPEGAVRTTVLEGSSPQVTAEGRIVTLAGPFPPGRTVANVAYHLPYSGPRVRFEQPLPVALTQVSAVVRRFGELAFTSPQVVTRNEMQSEGQSYYVGGGPGLPAGSAVAFELTGLPYRPAWPRNVTLLLAGVAIGAGIWAMVMGGPRPEDVLASRLAARRDRLMGELVRIEQQHLKGHGDAPRYAARRRELVGQLERVYAELDELGGVGTARDPDAPATGQPGPVGAKVSAAR